MVIKKDKRFVNIGHARVGGQAKIMEKIIKDRVCPFCWEHFTQYHPKPIIKKNKHWLLTENAWPYKGATKHFIFVARRHIAHVKDLTLDEWGDLLTLIKFCTKKKKVTSGAFLIRFGMPKITGASVTHLHGHIVMGGKKTKNSKPLLITAGYQKK